MCPRTSTIRFVFGLAICVESYSNPNLAFEVAFSVWTHGGPIRRSTGLSSLGYMLRMASLGPQISEGFSSKLLLNKECYGE
ncbi:hypothetical protein BJ170DRAFT_621283 [Xylariales sp. AK1849]|nr:hypothetical protein BJ170DRAFT_621283 [Xylariales sp. AK1849]